MIDKALKCLRKDTERQILCIRFYDCFGREFELSESVWEHVSSNHPEITKEIIQEVLNTPEAVVRSSWNFSSLLYYKKIGKYYKAVVAEIQDGRIKTALTTDKIKKGDIVWKRN